MGSASSLFRFDGVRFERIELPRDAHGSPVSIMYLFAPNDGGLWVGFTLGGAAHLKGGRWEIHGEREGLPPGSVKALAQEPDGTVWAGTTSGLARLEGKSWRRIGPDRGLPAINPKTLLFDSMGTLWVTARNEVYFLAKGALLFQKLGSSFVGRFMSIAESPSGEIWLSSEGQSVRRIRQNGTSPTAARSMHSMIAFDKDGALWMAGMEGVRRIPFPERESGKEIRSKDIADSFSASEGLTLPFSNGNILEDREGNVWLASGSALERLSERRLKRFLPSLLIDPLRLSSSDLGLTEGERDTVWLTSKGSSQRPPSEQSSSCRAATPMAPTFRDSCATKA